MMNRLATAPARPDASRTRVMIPRRDRGIGLVSRLICPLWITKMSSSHSGPRALANEEEPEDPDVQEHGCGDGAVDVHLVVALFARLDFDEHRRKGDRDGGGSEHDLAKQVQRLGMVAHHKHPNG